MAGVTKLAVIVHRWSGTPNSDWYPWLKRELESRGYIVLVPAMPDTDAPEITPWVQMLKTTLADNPAQQILLVGHSIGCQTILRYLVEALLLVDEALFVAGWTQLNPLDPEEKVIAEPWLSTPIDAVVAKASVRSTLAVFSKDDPLVPLSNQDFFRDQLGSQVVLLDGYGHFDEDSETVQIPELLAYLN